MTYAWRRTATMALLVVAIALPSMALEGTYSFEFLQVETTAARQVEQVRESHGELRFESDGSAAYNGVAAALIEGGFGRYRIASPIGAGDSAVDALRGAEKDVLLGVSGGDGMHGILLAVRRPSAAPAIPTAATFHGSLFQMLPSGTALAQSSFISFQPAVAGFVPAADGTGTAAIPGAGSFRVALSANGNYLIGAPVSGQGGLLFAVRQADAVPSGLLFALSLSVERDAMRAALGTMVIGVDGTARFSLKEQGPSGENDFRGTGVFTNWTAGAGVFDGHFAGAGAENAIAAAANGTDPAWMLAAIPVPMATDDGGVFLHPYGIVDAASSSPSGNPLSPNALVSLYGQRFSDGVYEAAQIPLPVELGGTHVEVNGRPAGLLMVSPGQINFHLPSDLAGSEAVIAVVNPQGRSASARIRLAPTSPGVFSLSQAGLGPGIVTHADYEAVSAARPARGGEVVIVFLTGLGVAPTPPAVTVNGAAAEVQYAGAHSVFVGLYQLNIKLPVFLAADPAATLTLRTREGFSDTVTMAVTP